MKASLARDILAAYPDPAPLRDVYRRLRLGLAGYAALERLLPTDGLLVDLGAGEGLMAHVLVRAAPGRRVVAVDHDAARAERLRQSAAGRPIEVVCARMEEYEIPPCQAVLLVDVLHYLDRAGQETVLARAWNALAPGGVLLLREPDAGAGLRFRWNRFHERLFTRFGWTRARIGDYRTARAWVAQLEDLGFLEPRLAPAGWLRPYADRTAVAVRPPSGERRETRPWHRRPAVGSRFDVPIWRTPACPVCGDRRRRVVLRHAEGNLARCAGCGLVSVLPLPSRRAALAQYDGSYFRGTTGYRDYPAEEANFRAEFRRRLRRIRAAGGRGRLLDVGAATGALMLEAAEAGFEVAGLEPSRAVSAEACARGLDVVTAPVEEADLGGAVFDVVTCFDALEHVVDPVLALRRMRAWTRPTGLLAVTVPDFGGWWARLSARFWPFVTPHEHLHYFTRRSLRSTLRAAGWEPVEVGLAGTPLSVGTLVREVNEAWGLDVDESLGALADRGASLPMGTLFAVARPA